MCCKKLLINNPTVSHFAGRNNGLVLIEIFAGDVSRFADMKFNSGHGRSGSPGLVYRTYNFCFLPESGTVATAFFYQGDTSMICKQSYSMYRVCVNI